MCNQLKTELYKLKKFPIMYIGILFMCVIGFVYGYLRFGFADNTSEVFAGVICDTSFIFLLAIISSWFISGDFGNRTITHEIKLGYSRVSVILTRLIVVSILAIILHLLFVVFTIFGYSVVNGFDTTVFTAVNGTWLATIVLQVMAIESLIVMLCFAVKKTAGAIAVSVIVIAVLCSILRNFMMGIKVFTISCFCLAQNNDLEWLAVSSGAALVCAVIFFGGAVWLFRRADIR